ncbi:MAG: hypothetical protein IPK56_10010 [Elusimicrobia bacterium]|nr:hypothetical protein [Elusimicrobiota bacterium]
MHQGVPEFFVDRGLALLVGLGAEGAVHFFGFLLEAIFPEDGLERVGHLHRLGPERGFGLADQVADALDERRHAVRKAHGEHALNEGGEALSPQTLEEFGVVALQKDVGLDVQRLFDGDRRRRVGHGVDQSAFLQVFVDRPGHVGGRRGFQQERHELPQAGAFRIVGRAVGGAFNFFGPAADLVEDFQHAAARDRLQKGLFEGIFSAFGELAFFHQVHDDVGLEGSHADRQLLAQVLAVGFLGDLVDVVDGAHDRGFDVLLSGNVLKLEKAAAHDGLLLRQLHDGAVVGFHVGDAGGRQGFGKRGTVGAFAGEAGHQGVGLFDGEPLNETQALDAGGLVKLRDGVGLGNFLQVEEHFSLVAGEADFFTGEHELENRLVQEGDGLPDRDARGRVDAVFHHRGTERRGDWRLRVVRRHSRFLLSWNPAFQGVKLHPSRMQQTDRKVKRTVYQWLL